MSLLFSQLTIKDVTFRNRLVVSPMCQYSSTDGFATDWHLVHLGSRAVGGAGLVIQEATAVSPEGRISYGDMGIWKDEHIDKSSQIVSFIHGQGSIAGIQLAHAGRKASCELPWLGGKQIASGSGSWKTFAPSPIPFYEKDQPPVELTKEGIDKVVTDFKAAASRAFAAGYKVIEIHGAHGYLINEFLSPLSNNRNDDYGGNFDNRIRLLLRIIEAIKSVWPVTLPIFLRISATDWAEGGWTIEDSVELASIVKEKGIDLVDCSSGGNVRNIKIPLSPGYQTQFSEQVKKETGILTGAVGLITNAKQAETLLSENKADMIMMAREFLRDPYFPLHAAEIVGDEITWPNQYARAKPAKS